MASIVYAGLIALLLLASRQMPSKVVRRSVSLFIASDDPGGEGTYEPGTVSRGKRGRLRMPFMIAVVPAVVTVWPVFP
jgi:hypothetical protein